MIKDQLLNTPCRYSNTPSELFGHLTLDSVNVLLLESAEIDSKDNLQSLMVIDSALKLTCHGRCVIIDALNRNGQSLIKQLTTHFNAVVIESSAQQIVLQYPQPDPLLDEDQRLKAPSPFSALRQLLSIIPNQQMLAGTFAYDMIATAEHLPEVPNGNNHCPDFVFYLSQSLLVLDHQTRQAILTSQIFDPVLSQDVTNHHQQLIDSINGFVDFPLRSIPVTEAVTVNVSDAEFMTQVKQLKQQIIAGNIFQVVPSRAFSLPCPNPLGAYHQLKQTNPSPYMFYVKDSDFVLFGASPESSLKYDKATNLVEVYPIAGTRRRGFNPDGTINDDLDGRIELDLRLDKKELAEHIMLVDLARNDVARISRPGTRKVAELLKVDRYSHVMHLVSRVTGQLRTDLDALHAYQACMNMGTLVGAPKIKAMELIEEFELTKRGLYSGSVGYIDPHGDFDFNVVIRSILYNKEKGYLSFIVGGAITALSDPEKEYDECLLKAKAMLQVLSQ